MIKRIFVTLFCMLNTATWAAPKEENGTYFATGKITECKQSHAGLCLLVNQGTNNARTLLIEKSPWTTLLKAMLPLTAPIVIKGQLENDKLIPLERPRLSLPDVVDILNERSGLQKF